MWESALSVDEMTGSLVHPQGRSEALSRNRRGEVIHGRGAQKTELRAFLKLDDKWGPDDTQEGVNRTFRSVLYCVSNASILFKTDIFVKVSAYDDAARDQLSSQGGCTPQDRGCHVTDKRLASANWKCWVHR